ncbi:MAG: FkbM family methyltransferase [Anaerolineales bacterium]|nr:MAG: FkbM family methyltransferase [Anaerolineales bacterium]
MFIPITEKRKKQFCAKLFSGIQSPIGFIDVGSGGALKPPWTLLPTAYLNKIDFDPEEIRSDKQLPVCISNKRGMGTFFIAHDPRASSLHPPSQSFARRFGQDGILTKEGIQVELTTLDSLFMSRHQELDLLDINVEGHDYFVLEGAAQLLKKAFIKCIKIEFELTEVWQGQGWFSEIDKFLRSNGYDLVNIDIEYSRPVNARSIYHQGEPLWGKAIYFPSVSNWEQKRENANIKDDILKAVGLYVILDLPGRAIDILNIAAQYGCIDARVEREKTSEIVSIFHFAKFDYWINRLLRKIG